MKAKERIYKGIEFISVAELPADQQFLLKHNHQPERIKILVDGKILSNCIQYKNYSDWYHAVFTQSVNVPQFKAIEEKVFRPLEIALTKV